MIRTAATLLALLLPVAAQATEFAAPPDVSAVATSRAFNENGGDVAYRATIKDLRNAQKGTLLIIEKIQVSYDAGVAPQLLWQEEWTVDDLGRAPQAEFNRLNDQARQNCCGYNLLQWQERMLYFTLAVGDRKEFRCVIPVDMKTPANCNRTR